MKKQLKSEKHKGRTITFIKEDYPLQGRFRSVPTVRAFITIQGTKIEVGQGTTKEIAFAQARRKIDDVLWKTSWTTEVI